MPFASKAQMRKFFVLERQGKIKKGTTKEFLDATPNIKKLPERLVKKSFVIGFEKTAVALGIAYPARMNQAFSGAVTASRAAKGVAGAVKAPMKPIKQVAGATDAALDRYRSRIGQNMLSKSAMSLADEAALEVVNMADRIPGTELRANAETGQARGRATRTFNVKNEDKEFGQKFRRSADTSRGGKIYDTTL